MNCIDFDQLGKSRTIGDRRAPELHMPVLHLLTADIGPPSPYGARWAGLPGIEASLSFMTCLLA
jgi:hypothetical protein